MGNDLDLDGARVLVVGASSGIGKATAERFARANAKVFSASRGGPRLLAAAAEINAEPITLDIRDNAAVEALFAKQAPFDHVVISAAETKTGSVASLALEDAREAMDSKFWGTYYVARSVKINAGGSLTLVSGALARRPSTNSVLGGALCAALEALARGLALELAPVRVNTIQPGMIATPLWSALPQAQREGLFASMADRLLVKRVGEADDVAAAICFVATNPFMTAATVAVDGGRRIV